MGPSSKIRVAVLSLSLNLLLFGLKLGMGLISGSIALVTDAIHSSTDIISSLALLIGIKISDRKTRNFPFGLYKVENLISVGIAFILFLTGYEIFREVFIERHFLHLHHPYLAMATAGVAACMTYLFSIYEIKVGKRENSPALLADGRHIRMDAVVSLVVLLGLAGTLLHLPAEKAATLVVIVFILKSGWGILLESIRVLLDASIAPQTLDHIRQIIMAHPDIAEIREIAGRNSGSYTFIEGTLTVKTRDFSRAHQVIEEITKRIRDEVPHIDRIVLHYEPGQKPTFLIAVMLSDSKKWRISPHFGEAPFIGWIEIQRQTGRFLRMETTPNPYIHLQKGKGIRVAEHLVSRGVDLVLIREPFHGRGPEIVFRGRDVKVVRTSEEIIDKDFIARVFLKETGQQISKS